MSGKVEKFQGIFTNLKCLQHDENSALIEQKIQGYIFEIYTFQTS